MADEKSVLISACLLGKKCRYDGGSCTNQDVLALYKGWKIIPVCPEEIGGLSTPRPRARIVGGTPSADGNDVLDGHAKVVTDTGEDVTDEYLRGGAKTLEIAREANVEFAILKANSPSCGCGAIFNEDFSGLRAGDGATAALLKRAGIPVKTENELDPED